MVLSKSKVLEINSMIDEQIYAQMVANSYAHQMKTEGHDEYVKILKNTQNGITVYDQMEYPFDRTYTITHPKKMTQKWLADRIIVTPSANKFNLHTENVIKWIHKNLLKCFYCTLNYIVFLGDDEKAEFNYLQSYNEFFSRAVIEHDLPRVVEQLGVNWFSDACVIISLGNIFAGTDEMLADGCIRQNEIDECNNHGVAETLIHELRHLAQANPYIPKEVFRQRHQDLEEDAEIFAREFCEKHFVYAV